MESMSPEFLDELVDFSPADGGASASIGELQREGTVAAFNMLAHNGCAYLADEVGMGKTYMALGVMTLLRYFDPHARVIVIAPRQNIQEKWRKELTNFVRNNWKIVGNRVKTLEGTPVWEPVVCGNLPTFAHEALLNQDRDFFLRMTSFSLVAKNPEDRKRSRKWILDAIPWLDKRDIDVSSAESFLDTYAVALNGAIPDADLLIVDEAHNLKQGFGEKVSNRNRVMGLAFGHTDGRHLQREWYKRKAKRVLFLSATPFEDDYAAIHRQLGIFGFGDANLTEPGHDDTVCVNTLSDPQADASVKKRIVERLLIRRTSGIMVANEKYTKNMYRREWRKGGIETYDRPITIDDLKTRLIVALMQKKVAEVLQTEKFNNSFQIGMLSSFETFAQDVNTAMRQDSELPHSTTHTNAHDRTPTFDDADQQTSLSQEERDGIDSNAIARIAHSFEETFNQRLPHPKLDHVAETLSDVFQSGDKALVFVRRVATVRELAGKMNLKFNAWVEDRMTSFLPDLNEEIRAIFAQYRQELKRERLNLEDDIQASADIDSETPDEPVEIVEREDLELANDIGGVQSFFEWFFRGEGPRRMLSGAALQRNRLSATGSVYSTLFEDNYAADLLNVEPRRVLAKLATTVSISVAECVQELRELAYAYFSARSGQKEGYPRLYVYESFQVAALKLLADSQTDFSHNANIILQERYVDVSVTTSERSPQGFPSPLEHLSTETIFTELKRYDKLCAELWPFERERATDFRLAFRHREQRRQLFSALARLGSAYIDLYLVAIKIIGSFELHQREREENFAPQLAKEFVALLHEQRGCDGFHAYRELSEAARTFDTLVAVNFPDIEQQPLASLTRYFGTSMGQQVPIGEVAGQVNRRVVAQFRMPGFPLVLISTDVLQEGEDLHTYCRRVLHYGIAWTPSSIEQRTGRIDRIGGLVQRNLDGRCTKPHQDEFIQVFYPHLRDTVELLQVRRVLGRLNRFLELMHEDLSQPNLGDSSIDTNKAFHDEAHDVPQYTQPLKSAFDVKEQWLTGNLNATDVRSPNWDAHYAHLAFLRSRLQEKFTVQLRPSRFKHEFSGTVFLNGKGDEIPTHSSSRNGSNHEFTIRLTSHVAGEQTLLQCESPVGEADLSDSDRMSALTKLVKAAPGAKICVEPRVTRSLDRIFVRQEILFDPDVSQVDDLCHLFEMVVPTASKLIETFYDDNNHVN